MCMCGYLGLGPVERLAPLLADVLADRLVLGQLLGGASDRSINVKIYSLF